MTDVNLYDARRYLAPAEFDRMTLYMSMSQNEVLFSLDQFKDFKQILDKLEAIKIQKEKRDERTTSA